MMKNFPIQVFFSPTLLIAIFMLASCDQLPQESQSLEQNNATVATDTSIIENNTTHNPTAQDTQTLSHGNVFNIAHDVTKLQLATQDYIILLEQSQNHLQQAIQNQNIQQLQNTTGNLRQELQGLHNALLSLDLKSHEADQIRQSLLSANQQLLTMPFLHGQLDLAKLDFEKIEKQFNTIQMDMVKLVTLVLAQSTHNENSDT